MELFYCSALEHRVFSTGLAIGDGNVAFGVPTTLGCKPLGSGRSVMLPGLELCPGEVACIVIPPALSLARCCNS